MASQRLFIATLTGSSAVETARLFLSWRTAGPAADATAIDRFCSAVRDNATSLPIVYFSEWIDRWLTGDQVPGPAAVEGRRHQAACFSRDEAVEWAGHCGGQHREQEWLAARLREAASAWGGLTDQVAIVVVREAFGPSALDQEVEAAIRCVPAWLSRAGD